MLWIVKCVHYQVQQLALCIWSKFEPCFYRIPRLHCMLFLDFRIYVDRVRYYFDVRWLNPLWSFDLLPNLLFLLILKRGFNMSKALSKCSNYIDEYTSVYFNNIQDRNIKIERPCEGVKHIPSRTVDVKERFNDLNLLCCYWLAVVDVCVLQQTLLHLMPLFVKFNETHFYIFSSSQLGSLFVCCRYLKDSRFTCSLY